MCRFFAPGFENPLSARFLYRASGGELKPGGRTGGFLIRPRKPLAQLPSAAAAEWMFLWFFPADFSLPVFACLPDLVFFSKKNEGQKHHPLVLSLLFYAWGEPVWVILLIFSGFVDYFNGRIIEANRGTKYAKMALIASIVINLGLLGVFKYSAFFIQSINGLFSAHLPFAEFARPSAFLSTPSRL